MAGSPAMISVLPLGICILSGLLGLADANAFRGSGLSTTLGQMSVAELRATLLDELMSALGSGDRMTEQRLNKIEETVRPTYLSMHKNEHGNLEHSSVRYVLHRYFVQRHGMYVKGLEPGGESWNGTSPTVVLEDKVPAFVQALFEERLNGRGLGIHEIAILAATLEHLIHNEAETRLKAAYQVHGLTLEDRVGQAQAEDVIDTYMVLFLLGKNASVMTPEDVRLERDSILEVYPSWPESQKFAREVQRTVTEVKKMDSAFSDDKLAFNGTAHVVEEIGERYGRWQDAECHDLKAALVKLESKGSGRVLLKDFYGDALGGAWQFTESVAYLRELGALDETDPKQQSVIISNYINSPSNCLASSSIFSVCCLNECEALLGHLERETGEPDVDPERIADLVSNLPSSTIQAPRKLPEILRSRLDEVANFHRGLVPLHSRLFAQWMHHAFPRECPYPHKSGTTNPMTADAWMEEKGAETLSATEDDMRLHTQAVTEEKTDAAVQIDTSGESPSLMWTVEEELVVATTAPPARRTRAFFRNMAMIVALFSACVSLWKMFGSALSSVSGGTKDVLPFAQKSHYC